MEKIKNLREIFKREQIDGYLIPKNDEFFCEYISDYNDRLKFITNFSGSYGFSVILKKKNYLFVDGRYTLQAESQSGKFYKVITFPNFMPRDVLKDKRLLIGFDPKLITRKTFNYFFNNCSCKFKPLRKNLIDEIWKRKIKKNKNNFFILPNRSVGSNHKEKIKKVTNYLKKKGADYQFITASENNAWLLNIRGRDTKYSPMPHSYALIDKGKKMIFFCDLSKVSLALRKKLNDIKFVNIDNVKKILASISKRKIILDRDTCSIDLENLIGKNNKILNFNDPIYNLKSIKHKTEIENIQKAHIYDGVALTKYLLWLKKSFNKKTITEISASTRLYRYRKRNNKFKFSSFPTISGTGPNGAIIHYQATKDTNRKLKIGDVYLVDSGGQYEFGTTDVTRTISLNNSNKRVKKIFTRVLKGHIAVSNFKLKKDTSGSKIDKEAIRYLKQIGLDYSHGTGHGVGYYLNVHEGPHAISRNNKIKIKEGMIFSNEPGYYEKNKFGIRIENLIYVKNKKNKMYFENLTMAPIDKDLIDHEMLSKNEKLWLNTYHEKVFQNLRSSMNKLELKDLIKACSAI